MKSMAQLAKLLGVICRSFGDLVERKTMPDCFILRRASSRSLPCKRLEAPVHERSGCLWMSFVFCRAHTSAD
jgi:hypothetical protein